MRLDLAENSNTLCISIHYKKQKRTKTNKTNKNEQKRTKQKQIDLDPCMSVFIHNPLKNYPNG